LIELFEGMVPDDVLLAFSPSLGRLDGGAVAGFISRAGVTQRRGG